MPNASTHATPVEASHPALVSVCVPTYNRAETLQRTLASVVQQSYRRLEILVYDDASHDGTPNVCARFAELDPRLQYVRRTQRVGLTANFNALYADCTGDFVLAISDDDWLDHDYVANCVAELDRLPDHVIVGGLTRYYGPDGYARTGTNRTLNQRSAFARVVRYCAVGGDTGSAYYGLIRGSALKRAAPMQDVAGNDWLLVAALAYQGKVRTLRNVAVHRELGGVSAHLPTLVQRLGGGSIAARFCELHISLELVKDILWRGPVYQSAGAPQRVLLAACAAAVRTDWTAQAWYLAEPVARTLERRRTTRWMARAFDRVTRRVLERRHARLSAVAE
jgi:hypothetical protein